MTGSGEFTEKVGPRENRSCEAERERKEGRAGVTMTPAFLTLKKCD